MAVYPQMKPEKDYLKLNKAIKKKVGTEVEIVSLLSDVMVGGGQEVFEKFGIVKIRRTHPGMVITLLDYVFKEKKKPKKKSEVDKGYRWDDPDAF